MIEPKIKPLLIELAKKYETRELSNGDIIKYLQWYKSPCDIEIGAFIFAILSLGQRKQFVPKIDEIFTIADTCGGICAWLLNENFKTKFDTNDSKKFYRFYSFADMNLLFSKLSQILREYGSLGNLIKQKYEKGILPEDSIRNIFKNIKIVPQNSTSANKRVNMFLKWMVRQNSPVDIGLWNWFDAAKLLIPLDVHVINEAIKLGLIPKNVTASHKTAVMLSQIAKEIWPNDPCKLDYALFGLGVDL